MTTLTQPGLSSLIDRLFAEADAAEDARWPATAGDRADYHQYYRELKDQPLPVASNAEGVFFLCHVPTRNLGFVNVPIKGMKQDILHLINEELAMQYLPSARIKRFRLATARATNTSSRPSASARSPSLAR
jgi:hypothetical protein